MAPAPPNTLDRLLDPILTGDVARRVVAFEVDPASRQRLEDLRAKANEGLLSAEERAEYEQFVESLDLVAILKSKARDALARQAS